MKHTIISGKYETGTEKQRDMFRALFGKENTQYLFDLYFHWYNVVHEVGHILVFMSGKPFSKADTEQIVNEFAVAYWKELDIQENLCRLRKVVHDILKKLERPIPENISYLDYFRNNWDNLEMTVPVYGFFQMSCVESSLKSDKNVITILDELGFHNLNLQNLSKKNYEISSKTASEVINDCKTNMRLIGIELPTIEIILVNNPEVQCCQYEE